MLQMNRFIACVYHAVTEIAFLSCILHLFCKGDLRYSQESSSGQMFCNSHLSKYEIAFSIYECSRTMLTCNRVVLHVKRISTLI